MGENRLRSILKAVSWRLLGTIDTIVISFLLSGTIKLALSIGGVELFSKIFLFYFHERIWNKVNYGKKNKTTQ